MEIECVHFFSYPYTSQLAKDKVLELARLVTRYSGKMTVNIVSFTEIQEAIRDGCPEEYFTLIMRRFMMRIAQEVADRLIALGVQGIWNFTNVELTAPESSTIVENIHFSDSLLSLSYYISEDNDEKAARAARMNK